MPTTSQDIRTVEDIDFSVSQGENRSDAILIVEGKAIYVNKQYLGMHSPTFQRLFFGNFYESLAFVGGNPEDEGKDGFNLEEIEYKHIGTTSNLYDGLREFNLKNVAFEKFMDLLHVIYPSRKKITEDTAEDLLNLGYHLKIPCVIDRAEAVLIKSRTISVAEKLRIADKYKLFKLQDSCFSQLTVLKDFIDVKWSPAYKTLSDATKAALFEQLLKKIK
ncbi:hypothetical protein PMAYCL1PPCAC_25870 [Pristionchus mayeri]|uniref:BTB domain-containing protein n=1 Tax=Pristionchus mayeri TaxID=1317129 RepID=A0AAN5D4P6_9BILA|nr:hypothetical protein PMAYCL1PPCAC_25870 [Pristionchus mayeri]